MKIRKILPLAPLALCAVFMLSSCDALLDAIFSNNTITVYISAYIPTYGYYPGSDYVTVDVSGPTSATATANYTGTDGWYIYWEVSVPKLADGSYTVSATFYYYNGFGNFSNGPSVQFATLPSAGNHTVYLNYNF